MSLIVDIVLFVLACNVILIALVIVGLSLDHWKRTPEPDVRDDSEAVLGAVDPPSDSSSGSTWTKSPSSTGRA